MPLFNSVEMAPRDPILGINEQFAADLRPNKVNLGVGVYFDDDGRLPLLDCVREAEHNMMEAPKARGYLPIDGMAAYDSAVKNLVFGAASEPVVSNRVATVQGLGGTGGLKIGADFLQRLNPEAKVLISDPSWENHRALFTQAGFTVETYPYYDAPRRAIDFDGMLGALQRAPAGTIAVLHACCHNPTGYDLTPQQWDQVVDVVKQQRLVPFLDMAYQGFAQGISDDGLAVHKFVAAGLECFVATSFSKSFSLYGERVGALSVLCADREQAAKVLSQLKIMIRTNYSNPPIHGAMVVAMVLDTPKLRAQWERGTGADAGPDQVDAPALSRWIEDRRCPAGHGLHYRASRHVQLFGPEPRPDGAATRGFRRLWHRQRTHVRRRTEQPQHRARLRVGRTSAALIRRASHPFDRRAAPARIAPSHALSTP